MLKKIVRDLSRGQRRPVLTHPGALGLGRRSATFPPAVRRRTDQQTFLDGSSSAWCEGDGVETTSLGGARKRRRPAWSASRPACSAEKAGNGGRLSRRTRGPMPTARGQAAQRRAVRVGTRRQTPRRRARSMGAFVDGRSGTFGGRRPGTGQGSCRIKVEAARSVARCRWAADQIKTPVVDGRLTNAENTRCAPPVVAAGGPERTAPASSPFGAPNGRPPVQVWRVLGADEGAGRSALKTAVATAASHRADSTAPGTDGEASTSRLCAKTGASMQLGRARTYGTGSSGSNAGRKKESPRRLETRIPHRRNLSPALCREESAPDLGVEGLGRPTASGFDTCGEARSRRRHRRFRLGPPSTPAERWPVIRGPLSPARQVSCARAGRFMIGAWRPCSSALVVTGVPAASNRQARRHLAISPGTQAPQALIGILSAGRSGAVKLDAGRRLIKQPNSFAPAYFRGAVPPRRIRQATLTGGQRGVGDTTVRVFPARWFLGGAAGVRPVFSSERGTCSAGTADRRRPVKAAAASPAPGFENCSGQRSASNQGFQSNSARRTINRSPEARPGAAQIPLGSVADTGLNGTADRSGGVAGSRGARPVAKLEVAGLSGDPVARRQLVAGEDIAPARRELLGAGHDPSLFAAPGPVASGGPGEATGAARGSRFTHSTRPQGSTDDQRRRAHQTRQRFRGGRNRPGRCSRTHGPCRRSSSGSHAGWFRHLGQPVVTAGAAEPYEARVTSGVRTRSIGTRRRRDRSTAAQEHLRRCSNTPAQNENTSQDRRVPGPGQSRPAGETGSKDSLAASSTCHDDDKIGANLCY